MVNKIEMDMLRQDKFIVLMCILLLFFSCKEKTTDNNIVYKNISINTIGNTNLYKQILAEINDSLSNWEINHIAGYRSGNCDYSKYIVDSLLCFNHKKNKLVTCLLERGCNEDYGDGIHFFYGVRIKEQWYYFNGAYIFLPREMYQKDTHTPLSFEKLHEIAMREVYSGYLIKHKKDAGFWKNTFSPEYEYEVNEEWFDRHFKTSWGYYKNDEFITPSTDEEWDKIYLEKALSIWKK